ncbi:MAG: hypothetical protein ACOYKA_03470 [Legionellaceae bacterium]
MSHKKFAERLNQAFDNIGAPTAYNERIDAFAKLIKVHRFKAESLLNGEMMPDPALLSLLCSELDVEADWLLG